MGNWFQNKEEEHKVYTIKDKEREQREFRVYLDLKPINALWQKVVGDNIRKHHTLLENYRDFLSIMKSFWGEENALIKRFEVLLNRFDNDCDAYYRAVRESIDKALEEKRLELKSKQDGEEH